MSRRAPSVKPLESLFEPVLPPEVVRETPKNVARTPDAYRDRRIIEIPDDVEEMTEPGSQSQEAKLEAPQFVFGDQHVTSDALPETEAEPELEQEEAEDGLEEQQLVEDQEQVLAISKRIAEGGQVVRRDLEHEPEAPPMPLILRIILALLLLTGGSLLVNFKQESAPLGFCETGKSTNAVLEASRARWAAIESCNTANSSLLYPDGEPSTTGSVHSPVPTQTPVRVTDDDTVPEGQLVKGEPCPPLPILPVPHPTSCAKCPPHATCTPSTMTCETGFLIRPHPALIFLRLPNSPSPATSNAQQSYSLPYLSDIPDANLSVSQLLYKYISLALDGIPGLGPVAFSPKCVEDPRRRRNIGVLGRAVESILAQERGRRLCAGEVSTKPFASEAEEVKKWGIQVDDLKESIKSKTAVSFFVFQTIATCPRSDRTQLVF